MTASHTRGPSPMPDFDPKLRHGFVRPVVHTPGPKRAPDPEVPAPQERHATNPSIWQLLFAAFMRKIGKGTTPYYMLEVDRETGQQTMYRVDPEGIRTRGQISDGFFSPAAPRENAIRGSDPSLPLFRLKNPDNLQDECVRVSKKLFPDPKKFCPGDRVQGIYFEQAFTGTVTEQRPEDWSVFVKLDRPLYREAHTRRFNSSKNQIADFYRLVKQDEILIGSHAVERLG